VQGRGSGKERRLDGWEWERKEIERVGDKKDVGEKRGKRGKLGEVRKEGRMGEKRK
jgi:hypothetical protein